MSTRDDILDRANLRSIAAAVAADAGSIAIENIAGTLKQVDDQGVATSLGGGGGAPSTATYITQTPDASLSAEQALSALASGLLYNTTGTGVLTKATAAQVASAGVGEYYTSLSGGAATSLTLSGLDGDTDGDYMIDINIVAAAGTNTIGLSVNGATATNMNMVGTNGFVGATQRNSDWELAWGSNSPVVWAASDAIYLQGRMRVRSGRARVGTLWGPIAKGGTNQFMQMTLNWSDTASNMTSFGVYSNVASGLGTATFIRFVRVQTTNPLA